MKKYIKVYMDGMGFVEGDYIPCEYCHQHESGPPHHIIARGMGGSKHRDVIENLIGLCIYCHERAENRAKPKIPKKELKTIVRKRSK